MRNPAMPATRPGPGPLGCLLAASLVLSGCALKDTVPGYEPQVSDRALAADWPELTALSAFSSTTPPLSSEATAEEIAARAEALRRRARLLNRPVLTGAEAEQLSRTIPD